MSVAVAVQTGIAVAKGVGRAAATAGKAVLKGGAVVHNYLEKTMVTDNRQMADIGREDFPPLTMPVTENTGYKIKLLENTAKTLGDPVAFSMIRGIIDQINDERYKVLIVGRYNTGKKKTRRAGGTTTLPTNCTEFPWKG